MRSFLIAGMLAIIIGAGARTAACPLCLGPTKTWAEIVADADVVILARLVSRESGSENVKPFATFEIMQQHKCKLPLAPKQNALLNLDEFVSGEPGDYFLLTGVLRDPKIPTLFETFAADPKRHSTEPPKSVIQPVSAKEVEVKSDSQQRILSWDAPEPVTLDSWNYVTKAPSPDNEPVERLAYFLTFLQHRDTLIAADAWGEFAIAEYETIKSLSAQFSTEKLRRWIADRETNPERLSLYGLMLGMCGTADDAEFLREQIGRPGTDSVDFNSVRFGNEGLMGGLLVLAAEDGLRFLEETRFANPDVAVFETLAALKAVEFAWSHEIERFNKPRLQQSLHLLLHSDAVRELVIVDLARWEDWSVVSQLPAVYAVSRSDDDGTTRAIVGYLIVYLKANADVVSDDRTLATDLLQKIREDNPRLVRSIERQLK